MTAKASVRWLPRAVVLLTVGLVVAAALLWNTSVAAFIGKTTNSGNGFAAAATFPTYAQAVTGDSPILYYRLDEAASASSTSAATDSGPYGLPATYNGATNGPSTWWKFNENVGTTVLDSAGGAVLGSLGSGAGWTTGTTGYSAGSGASLNGTSTGYVAGSGPAVGTTQSFSVATWVQITSSSSSQTIVSQDGASVGGFSLDYDKSKSGGVWGFSVYGSDGTGATQYESFDPTHSDALANTWVHLVGVYDKTAGTVTLYVNGTVSGTPTAAAPFDATGSLQVGRQLWGAGSYRQPLAGSVDDVITYRRALSATEIGALHTAPPTAALTAGQAGALVGAQSASTAVAFAGTVGAYESPATAASAVGTEECWFKASGSQGGDMLGISSTSTGNTDPTNDRVLYLDNAGRIINGVISGGVKSTVRSPLAYNDGRWHHVADSVGPAGLRLYVDGNLVDSTATPTSATSYTGYPRAGGESLVAWPNRPASDYFVGTLDEVAFYQTQLTDTQISIHYHANH
jgi:hypothetical protein